MCKAKANDPQSTEHEAFIAEVARLAIARLSPEDRDRCKARIVYGVGYGLGARGICHYGAWQNGEPKPIDLVEICAFGEESLIQVAGTTIHEVGHVLAGPGSGHGKEWKDACRRLGLRCAVAAGMRYSLAALAPEIREVVWLHEFSDGRPQNGMRGINGVQTIPKMVRPCSQGVGTRGGKSRGKGSGSRYRKYVCSCDPAVIVRASRDDLHATCDDCGEPFVLA